MTYDCCSEIRIQKRSNLYFEDLSAKRKVGSSVVNPDPDPLKSLPDPHPHPLVTRTVRIRLLIRILQSSSKNIKKNLDFYCFMTSLLLFTSVPDPHPDPYVFGPPRSKSGSFRLRYGPEDPDQYQNVPDPQHWKEGVYKMKSVVVCLYS